MENDKTILGTESDNQALKEGKVLELLDKFDEITLTDAFNRDIMARIEEEKTPSSRHWYKPLVAVAASLIAVIMIWSYQKTPTVENPVKVNRSDILVIENLELLDNMELLDHLDVLIDTTSTQEFLQLLEKG